MSTNKIEKTYNVALCIEKIQIRSALPSGQFDQSLHCPHDESCEP